MQADLLSLMIFDLAIDMLALRPIKASAQSDNTGLRPEASTSHVLGPIKVGLLALSRNDLA